MTARLAATSCARCHGVEGRGRAEPGFPRLAGQQRACLRESLRAYADGARHSIRTPTPPADDVRLGQGTTALDRETCQKRFDARFTDPAFDAVSAERARLAEVAWQGYEEYRKDVRLRAAGEGFAEPHFPLPLEWLDARQAILAAAARQRQADTRSTVLLVCASPRTDETCPGEMSKTFRLTSVACQVFEAAGTRSTCWV